MIISDIKVLSVFDGMSCGQIALNRANIKYSQYFASEIDKHAIQVTQHNYPNTIQLGDVTKVSGYDLPKIDLFFGGSPCQGFSLVGKMLNFDDPRSKLFFEYVRILNELREKNPNIKFLLENVRMKKWCQDVISRYLGVEPIMINSNLVSAQNRERYYWTNIDFNTNIKDKGLVLRDILEKEVDEKYFLNEGRLKWLTQSESGQKCLASGYAKIDPIIAQCLTRRGDASWNCNYVTDNGKLRRLTPIEHERLQTVPDGYTSIVEDSNRFEMLGNGWTVDIIAIIFQGLANKKENVSRRLSLSLFDTPSVKPEALTLSL